jgi:hypothetical protein
MSSSLGSKPEFPFWMLNQTRIKTWWLANAKAQLRRVDGCGAIAQTQGGANG